MISQRARYAFKALIVLARAGTGSGMQIRDIAQKEQIPRKFLEQILLTLKAGGLIVSRRGRDGGYALLKAPEEISLGVVMIARPKISAPCARALLKRTTPPCGCWNPPRSRKRLRLRNGRNRNVAFQKRPPL
jgi:Rrf2 family protein